MVVVFIKMIITVPLPDIVQQPALTARRLGIDVQPELDGRKYRGDRRLSSSMVVVIVEKLRSSRDGIRPVVFPRFDLLPTEAATNDEEDPDGIVLIVREDQTPLFDKAHTPSWSCSCS